MDIFDMDLDGLTPPEPTMTKDEFIKAAKKVFDKISREFSRAHMHIICKQCNGSGMLEEAGEMKDCLNCDENGNERELEFDGDTFYEEMIEIVCGGNGIGELLTNRVIDDGWFDVKDAPDNDRRVIVKNKEFTSIIPHSYSNGRWFTYDNSDSLPSITNWMDYPS